MTDPDPSARFAQLHLLADRSRPGADELLEGLTEPQRRAVTHRGGPLLVVAGAGSGKTRVLTRRIAHLLATGDAMPQQILAITFTNKAAAEMVDRLVDLVGDQARRMWVMTFHKAFFRILQREAELLGYRSRLTLYDDTDSRRLLQEILHERGLDPKKLSPRMVAGRISSAKANLVSPADFAGDRQRFVGPFQDQISSIYAEYEARLLAASAVDFDDLLLKPVELFRRFPEVRDAYAARFTHLLVDEFQDTNRAQNELVLQLGSVHRNVCVVGDSDQSIYRFRAADIRNILDFESTFPDAEVIVLEQNFRSTQTILDAANAVIANNQSRVVKRLFTDLGQGRPIVVYGAMDDRDEAAWIAAQLQQLATHEGLGYDEMAVFYRTNAQSRVLEEALNLARVPFKLVGATRFYDRREVRDLLAYVRLLVNPSDEVSARRIVNVPRRGVGATSVAKLGAFAAAQGCSFEEAIARAGEAGLTGKARTGCEALAAMLAALRAELEDLSPAQVLAEALDRSGLREELEAEDSVEARSRLENLAELVGSVVQLEADGAIDRLEDFLEAAALTSAQDDLDGQATVSLMTLHVAKGLEFQAVFLSGLEEGTFPHYGSRDDEESLEEERRLAYVGITRARRFLHLSHAERRFRFGGERGANISTELPSRFLTEVPVELTLRLGTAGMPRPRRYEPNDDPIFDPPDDRDGGRVFGGAPVRPAVVSKAGAERLGLRAGDQVAHDRWGIGTVVSVRGEGEMASAKVRFAEVGEKNLLLTVAPLRRV